ncbi:TPA_asm: hypothetical protein G4I74_002603 [Salmonella enterica subsp. enterica serovar Stanley]|nr:hypothetical protein [Salmonella enterica subsp. enterica serovar Stanley]
MRYALCVMRYAWAQDAFHHYLTQRVCRKEELAMMAMDQGHLVAVGVNDVIRPC